MRTHRMEQGSAIADLGCNGGGGTGSGLQWGRRHSWDRALGTRTCLRARVTRLGARMRVGHGHGWARARTRSRQLVRRQGTARAWRGLKLRAKDGLWKECD